MLLGIQLALKRNRVEDSDVVVGRRVEVKIISEKAEFGYCRSWTTGDIV
jgi:hypothetical protein